MPSKLKEVAEEEVHDTAVRKEARNATTDITHSISQ
jgi:hypothetical protein